jgi:hypothetical protein
MALVTYDVTASVVKKWIAQISTGNTTVPGTSDITGEWINLAAARVEDAMLEGGFVSSSVSSTDHPSAYYQLRHLVARLAAVYYVQSLGVPTDAGAAGAMVEATEKELASIANGRRIGELSNTDGPRGARLYLGDDSASDIDAHRAGFDDAL